MDPNTFFQEILIGQRVQNTIQLINSYFDIFHEIGIVKGILFDQGNDPCNNTVRKVGDWAEYFVILYENELFEKKLINELGLSTFVIQFRDDIKKNKAILPLLETWWPRLAKFDPTATDCTYGPVDKN